MDDLGPILLERHADLGRHRGGGIHGERPGEVTGAFLGPAPVHVRLQRLLRGHELLARDAGQLLLVGLGDDGDQVVDLVDEAAVKFIGEERELVLVGELVELARKVVGREKHQRVGAGLQHGAAQRHKQRFGHLGHAQHDDFAGLHALAAVEGEINQNIRIFIEHHARGLVGHAPKIVRRPPSARREAVYPHGVSHRLVASPFCARRLRASPSWRVPAGRTHRERTKRRPSPPRGAEPTAVIANSRRMRTTREPFAENPFCSHQRSALVEAWADVAAGHDHIHTAAVFARR